MGMWIYNPPATRFFTADQRAQIAAMFEGILPGGPHNPGATDANAAEYLDRLLAMDASTYYEIPAWKQIYSAALPALDAACLARSGSGLAQLAPDQMHSLLADLSAGTVPNMPAGFDQKKFFSTLRTHCIEACFADPRWGGNSDKVIWRWFGYLEPAQQFARAEDH